MKHNTNNRSLFLYTALIFIAAIIVIVISFLSQMNVEKQHEEYSGADLSGNSITEKTAQLSEENRILLETTKSLNENNSELTAENERLAEENAAGADKLKNCDMMFEIFNAVQDGDREKAAKLFEQLEPLYFTEEQNDFYIYLQKKIRSMFNYK